jgi:hypothetical protein
MSTVPSFKLYASDGITLVYTFPVVVYTNAPKSEKKTIIIEGQRAKGSLVIDGGEKSWNLELEGWITGVDYDAIAVGIYALEAAVTLNTKFVLKFERSSTEKYSYNVKRLEPIEYSQSLRTISQVYRINFLTYCW